MALTKIVTKKSVKYVQEKLYSITFNLSILDGTVEVINQDFSCEYRPGEFIVDKLKEVKEKMQMVIDNYKQEQVLFNNAKLNALVTTLQGGLI